MTREYPDPKDPMRSVIVRVRECELCPRLVESIEFISDANRNVKWLPKARPIWLKRKLLALNLWQ